MVLTRRAKESSVPPAATARLTKTIRDSSKPSQSPVTRKVFNSHTTTPTSVATKRTHLVARPSLSSSPSRLPKSASKMQLRTRSRKPVVQKDDGPLDIQSCSSTALGKRRQHQDVTQRDEESCSEEGVPSHSSTSPVDEFGSAKPSSTSPTASLPVSRSNRRLFDPISPTRIPASPSTKSLAHKVRRGAGITDVHAKGSSPASMPRPQSTGIPKFGTSNARPKSRLSTGTSGSTTGPLRYGGSAKQRGGSAAASSSTPASQPSTDLLSADDNVMQFGSFPSRNSQFSFTPQVARPSNESEKENQQGYARPTATKATLSLAEQQSIRKLNRAQDQGPPRAIQSRYHLADQVPSSSDSVKSKAALWEKSTTTPNKTATFPSRTSITPSSSSPSRPQSTTKTRADYTKAQLTQSRPSNGSHSSNSLATKVIRRPSMTVKTASTSLKDSPARSPFQHLPNPRPLGGRVSQHLRPSPMSTSSPLASSSSPLSSPTADDTIDLRGLAFSPTPDSPVVNFQQLLDGESLPEDAMDDSLIVVKSRRDAPELEVSTAVSAELPSIMSSLSLVSPAQKGPTVDDQSSSRPAQEGAVAATSAPIPAPSTSPDLESIIATQVAQLTVLEARLAQSEKRLAQQTLTSAKHYSVLENALQETEQRHAAEEEDTKQRMQQHAQASADRINALQAELAAAVQAEQDGQAQVASATTALHAAQAQLTQQSLEFETDSHRLTKRCDRVKDIAGQALTEKATAAWESLAGAAWSEAQIVDEQMEMCRILMHDLDLWEAQVRARIRV